jgi:hypothetical protein
MDRPPWTCLKEYPNHRFDECRSRLWQRKGWKADRLSGLKRKRITDKEHQRCEQCDYNADCQCDVFYRDPYFHCIPAFANAMPVPQTLVFTQNSMFLTQFSFNFEQFILTVPYRIPRKTQDVTIMASISINPVLLFVV